MTAFMADPRAGNFDKKRPQYIEIAESWRILWRMLEVIDHSHRPFDLSQSEAYRRRPWRQQSMFLPIRREPVTRVCPARPHTRANMTSRLEHEVCLIIAKLMFRRLDSGCGSESRHALEFQYKKVRSSGRIQRSFAPYLVPRAANGRLRKKGLRQIRPDLAFRLLCTMLEPHFKAAVAQLGPSDLTEHRC